MGKSHRFPHQALELDDQYADLHFRIARCHVEQEHAEQAYQHFVQARIWIPYVSGRIHESIRSLRRLPLNILPGPSRGHGRKKPPDKSDGNPRR